MSSATKDGRTSLLGVMRDKSNPKNWCVGETPDRLRFFYLLNVKKRPIRSNQSTYTHSNKRWFKKTPLCDFVFHFVSQKKNTMMHFSSWHFGGKHFKAFTAPISHPVTFPPPEGSYRTIRTLPPITPTKWIIIQIKCAWWLTLKQNPGRAGSTAQIHILIIITSHTGELQIFSIHFICKQYKFNVKQKTSPWWKAARTMVVLMFWIHLWAGAHTLILPDPASEPEY